MTENEAIAANNAKWNSMGISWSFEKVARRNGKNASDKTFYPNAGPVLVIRSENLQKFIDTDGRHLDAIVSHLDGQSFRVASQRVLRAAFEKGVKLATAAEMEALKQRVYDGVVLSARAPSVAVVEKIIKVIRLPDGKEYAGNDEMEFRQLFMAALVDLGVGVDAAQEKALSVKW